MPGWSALLTPYGRELLERATAEVSTGRSLAQAGGTLRSAGVDPDTVSAVLTQLDLRAKARTKFGRLSERLLLTPAGLEQATRAPVAARHARRFAAAGCTAVADLGCGIGAESLALQSVGITPHPVEIDPFTAAVAEHNLGLTAGAAPVSVRVADAETVSLDGVDGAFLDPARRTSGMRDTRRLTNPDDYTPSLTFAFGLGRRLPTGVKLGPGFDREMLPDDAEAQWVSMNGQLVETAVWFGALARPGIRRSALILRTRADAADGIDAADHAHTADTPDLADTPDHADPADPADPADRLTAHELVADGDAPDAPTRDLGPFLYEPDGAVIRARQLGQLAGELGAGMVHAGIAYLTGDTPHVTPFATTFRVLEELPAKEKHLRAALAARGIGRLEIKKRGVPVNPAVLRTRLRLSGPNTGTLVLTRAGDRHLALLVERVGR